MGAMLCIGCAPGPSDAGSSWSTGADTGATATLGESAGGTSSETGAPTTATSSEQGTGAEDGTLFDLGSAADAAGSGEGCDKIDILFVIDNSPSMLVIQDQLASAFPDFMEVIDTELVQNQQIDYRVGVVTSEMGGEDYCPIVPTACAPGFRGRLVHEQGRLDCADDLPEGKWISPGPVDEVAAQFTCIASFDEFWSVTEMPLETIRAAMIDRVIDDEAYNAEFFRDDALLVLVIVTDEDDSSLWEVPAEYPFGLVEPDRPVSDYWDAIVAAKGGEAGRITTVAISKEADMGCDDILGAPRIHELLELSAPNSFWTTICGDDYSAPLQEALEVVQDSCNNFPPPE